MTGAYERSAQAAMIKYRTDEAHVRHVAELAEQLFNGLSALHGLDQERLLELKLGSLLHDIGHFVGEKKHHQHSCYLILSDVLFKDWDPVIRGRVAYMALNHRKKRRLVWEGAGDGEQDELNSLTALLRMADALDYEHDQRVKLKEIRNIREERIVLIELSGMNLSANGKKLDKKLRWASTAWDTDIILVNGRERLAVLRYSGRKV